MNFIEKGAEPPTPGKQESSYGIHWKQRIMVCQPFSGTQWKLYWFALKALVSFSYGYAKIYTIDSFTS